MAVTAEPHNVDLREPASWRRTKNRIATAAMVLAFVLVIIPLGFVLYTVISKGASVIGGLADGPNRKGQAQEAKQEETHGGQSGALTALREPGAHEDRHNDSAKAAGNKKDAVPKWIKRGGPQSGAQKLDACHEPGMNVGRSGMPAGRKVTGEEIETDNREGK